MCSEPSVIHEYLHIVQRDEILQEDFAFAWSELKNSAGEGVGHSLSIPRHLQSTLLLGQLHTNKNTRTEGLQSTSINQATASDAFVPTASSPIRSHLGVELANDWLPGRGLLLH